MEQGRGSGGVREGRKGGGRGWVGEGWKRVGGGGWGGEGEGEQEGRGQGGERGECSHSPGHDAGSFSKAPLQNLIPADELLALGRQEAIDAANEPALQLVLILQVLLLDALLTRWAAAPPRLGALQINQVK